MGLGLSIALTVVVTALVAVPSWRLGKRLGAPPGQRNATPEEQTEWKRKRVAQRRAELAALTIRERVLFYAYYAVSIPALPAGLVLTIYGQRTTRDVGLGLLVVGVLLMATPVGPILGSRIRRRKRATSADRISEPG